jgi:hypothetical protein
MTVHYLIHTVNPEVEPYVLNTLPYRRSEKFASYNSSAIITGNRGVVKLEALVLCATGAK